MRIVQIVALVAAVSLASGCVSVGVGPDQEESEFEVKGFATAYVSADELPAYDGTILRANVFRNTEGEAEIISLSVWPLLDLGVGFVGARVQILTVEAGAGTLWYKPEAGSD